MKKILLASTALVGFAGAAAAEISLSGYAEIGISGGDGVGRPSNSYETQFHTDWQVNFNFSSTMDNGVEFGGKIQIEEGNTPSSVNGAVGSDDEAFWVSGAFGKVTLGETDGAFDWALSEIYTGTALTDDHSTHAGAYWFTGLDGAYDNQILRYEYSFGDFSVALSAEQDDDLNYSNSSTSNVINDGIVADTIWAVGGKWAGNVSGVDVGVGVGYQTADNADIWGLSGSAGFSNGVSVALGYADADLGGADMSWWGIGVAYTPATMSALTVGVNYGEYDLGTAADPSGWGLVANYDLGGGAVAMAGYGSSDNGVSGNGKGEDTFSLGLGMSF